MNTVNIVHGHRRMEINILQLKRVVVRTNLGIYSFPIPVYAYKFHKKKNYGLILARKCYPNRVRQYCDN